MHTLQVLEKKLGYTFRCKEQLQAALYHSSYANEHRCCGVSSNERLEFLGDAVLGLVTADYLYHKHPDLPEGDLTRPHGSGSQTAAPIAAKVLAACKTMLDAPNPNG